MNYRHSFHAGNFADVLKHAVLALVIEHLKRKPAPFRVIDTHAGRGIYGLDGDASRTGEWREGIWRLFSTGAGSEPCPQLAPYIGAVREANPTEQLAIYPGSPTIARSLLRPGETLVANELHPFDHAALEAHFRRDPQTKVMNLDAWVALRALLPPKERRGVILIDPPFEQPGEFHRIVDGLGEALRRFATGIFIVWFPIKDRAAVDAFYDRLREQAGVSLLAAELDVGRSPHLGGLSTCGLIIANAPYGLAETLADLGPKLASLLAQGPQARFDLSWLRRPA